MKIFTVTILAVLACGAGAALLLFHEFGRFANDVCPYGQKGEKNGNR